MIDELEKALSIINGFVSEYTIPEFKVLFEDKEYLYVKKPINVIINDDKNYDKTLNAFIEYFHSPYSLYEYKIFNVIDSLKVLEVRNKEYQANSYIVIHKVNNIPSGTRFYNMNVCLHGKIINDEFFLSVVRNKYGTSNKCLCNRKFPIIKYIDVMWENEK